MRMRMMMMMNKTIVLTLIINIITTSTIGARVLSSVHRVVVEFGTVGLQGLIRVLGLGLWDLSLRALWASGLRVLGY